MNSLSPIFDATLLLLNIIKINMKISGIVIGFGKILVLLSLMPNPGTTDVVCVHKETRTLPYPKSKKICLFLIHILTHTKHHLINSFYS
jgi:hypothetical protein